MTGNFRTSRLAILRNGYTYEDIDNEIEKFNLEIQRHDNDSYSNHIKQIETLQAKFASDKYHPLTKIFRAICLKNLTTT